MQISNLISFIGNGEIFFFEGSLANRWFFMYLFSLFVSFILEKVAFTGIPSVGNLSLPSFGFVCLCLIGNVEFDSVSLIARGSFGLFGQDSYLLLGFSFFCYLFNIINFFLVI